MDNEILSELRLIRTENQAARADIADVRVVLTRQAAILDEHTRRSLANEEGLKETRKEVALFREFTAKWAGAWTLMGVVGLVLSAAAAVWKLLGH